jgi:hypothetical protein
MSFLKSLSFWDWVDFGSLCMVLVGVWFGHIAAKNNSKAADFWEGVLIVGLAIEVISFPRRVVETAKANERAAKSNLALRTLEVSQLAFSMKDERASASRLSKFAGTEVRIEYSDEDGYSVLSLPFMQHLLLLAKWNIVSTTATNLKAGSIEIDVRQPNDWEKEPQDERTRRTKDAITALRTELADSGYAVAYDAIRDTNIAPLTAIIRLRPRLALGESDLRRIKAQKERTNETVPK